MKKLYLFRHAKAVKLTIGTADIERKLSSKGNKDAGIMARRLWMLGHLPELIITSPANRAVETAQILASEFKYPLQKIIQEPLLYSDNEKKVRSLIKTIDDKYQSILLVGHNPLLEEIVRYFTGDLEIKLISGGCGCVEFEINHWKRINKASGDLKLLDFPANNTQKNLLSRQVRKNLAQIIHAELENELRGIDGSAYEASEPVIHSSIQKVVKKFVKSLKFEKLARLTKNIDSETEPETPSVPEATTEKSETAPERSNPDSANTTQN
jgi:phosphohistidine phosphatase